MGGQDFERGGRKYLPRWFPLFIQGQLPLDAGSQRKINWKGIDAGGTGAGLFRVSKEVKGRGTHIGVKEVTQKTILIRIAGFAYRMRRRIATAAAVVLAVFLGYHVIFGRNGVTAYEQKRMEDKDLQKQILQLQDENSRMKDHVDHLQKDPDTIEHEARARLHYTRPGEIIYTLNDKATTSTAK